MSSGKPYVLFHAQACGSVFPQTVLHLLNVPHELVICDYEETTEKKGPNYARLVEANPLAQFPTLITPEGYVMTEMVAIVLYLQERHAKNTPWDTRSLLPSQLAAFYRWFIFIPANIYPVLTVGEFPARFVRVPEDAVVDPKTVEGWVTKGAFARREELWRMMEKEMTREFKDGKFLLGTEHPTLLDILVALVAHYTPHPRFVWLEENCPQLVKGARLTLKTDVVKDVFRENGLDDFL
ncbi:glutathione S-transferase [Ceratobasidium sp. AG-Ba]|nr:glutathione S-transferase [Ceratobasidium sp. AG-Ba]